MVSGRDGYRRRQARLSTGLAVGGVVLVIVGVLLTLSEVAGLVVPTVLAVAGVAALLAGVITGALLIAENARYHQSQSYYDDE